MRPSSVACPSTDITCARLVNGLITHDYVTTVSARAPSFTTSLVVSRISGALRNNIRPMGVETFKKADFDLPQRDREKRLPSIIRAPLKPDPFQSARDRGKQPAVPLGRTSLITLTFRPASLITIR